MRKKKIEKSKMTSKLVRAGFLFGVLLALSTHVKSAVRKLRKMKKDEEEKEDDGVAEFRQPRRREPVLFVL